MKTRHHQSGVIISLVLAVLLVPMLAGAAPSPQIMPSQNLFGQLTHQAVVARETQAATTGATDTLQPSMALLVAGAVEAQSATDAIKPESKQQINITPMSGPPGTIVTLTASGFLPRMWLRAALGAIVMGGDLQADETGSLNTKLTVPMYTPAGAFTLAVVPADGQGLLQAAPPETSQVTFKVIGASPSVPTVSQPAPIEAPNIPQFPGVPMAQQKVVRQSVTITAQPVKPWTLAVYMTADDPHANDYTGDIQELLNGLGNSVVASNIHVIVLVDGYQKPSQYLWVQNGTVTNITPVSLQNTNVDTGNPQAFVDFMTFVANNFPANRYAVSLWGHGGGWKGLQFDETSGNHWNMANLRDALSRGLAQLGKSRYDLLMFDECYMGEYEVLNEIHETVDVVVAASGEMPADGLPYDKALGQLGQPSLSPSQIAGQIVTAVHDTYGSTSTYAISAFTMSTGFNSASQTIDSAANELLRLAAHQGGDIIQAARVNSTNYAASFVDIGDFATKMRDSPNLNSPRAQNAANAVIAILTPGAGFVIANAYSPNTRPSYGLTGYFPEDDRGRSGGSRVVTRSSITLDSSYSQLRIQSSEWYRLLNALSTGQFPNLPPPSTAPGGQVPPPAAAAANSDIIFAHLINPQRVDLLRTASSGVETPLELLNDGYLNFYPRWSPDGSMVVYISDRNVPPLGNASIGRNLFIINSNGSLAGDVPTQLTNVGLNCPSGPLLGITCTIEQISHPAWLSDGSGLLYTLNTFDYSRFPITRRSTIRVVKPDGSQNSEVLPALAGAQSIASFLNYDTADLKAQSNTLQYLMFSYSVQEAHLADVSADIRVNTLGIFDFTNRDGISGRSISDMWILQMQTSSEFQAGNWLQAGLPAWHPGTNQIAFLYNRIGTPRILYSPSQIDPRSPLPPGQPDRFNPFYQFWGPFVFPTFDIGRLTILPGPTQGSGISYAINYPYFAFANSNLGVGANYRPNWKPNGTNNLTVAVSLGSLFGSSGWDVAVVSNNNYNTNPVLIRLTQDGLSATPAWGVVRSQDVLQRLEISPNYLAPGPTAAYILNGSGFSPGEQVILKANGQVIGQVTANARGQFTVRIALEAAPPGLIRFTAEGTVAGTGVSATRVSNVDEMVILQNGGAYLPLVVR